LSSQPIWIPNAEVYNCFDMEKMPSLGDSTVRYGGDP
jgi:hypothetical protein